MMQENMRSEVVEITPVMAQAWLEKNIRNNRRLNSETVKRYARIMKSGGWNLTHQGIAFDADGNLIDGQHRLNAIVSANTPVCMMVTTGVEHRDGEAFTIDVGQKRSITNIMQISGINDMVYKETAAVVSNYFRWKVPGGRRLEPVEIIDYIDRHYDSLKDLLEVIGANLHGGRYDCNCKRMSAFVAAALLSALYRGESKEALSMFCQVYRRNDVSGCEAYNPRHALNIRDYTRDHRPSTENFFRVESAISAFCANKKQLYVKDNHYPYDPVMDA